MLNLAIKAARAAGQYLLSAFKKPIQVSHKSRYEIVTPVDKGAEKIIFNFIKKKYPDHQFFGEEGGKSRNKSDFLWIVDPLDGTANFVMKNPLFCTSISLLWHKQPLLSVIYIPYLKELFFALKGKGAFLNTKKIRVSKVNSLKESLIIFCHGHRRTEQQKIIKIYQTFKLKVGNLRQLGSAGLEFAWVASGRAEAFLMASSRPWDLVAGTLLVKEAKGRVTDFKGKDWNFKNIKGVVASNDQIHQNLLALV